MSNQTVPSVPSISVGFMRRSRSVPVETWILLRGLSREAAHWGSFASMLAAALPEAAIVTIDLPGAGERRDERWPRTMTEAMELVRERAAHLTGRVFVFGVSLGGMLTMEWAARHPGELAGIAVGASSASDIAPFWKRFSPGLLPRIAFASLRGGVAAREAAVVRTVSNREDLWDETTAAWQAIQAARPVSTATVRAQITSATRWKAPVRLDVPALFLAGTRDRLTHADCSRALARRYAAPLVEHPTAGHDLTTDEPAWVTAELTRWRTALPLVQT